MAYSEDYRKRAVEYYQEGHTQDGAAGVFKVHRSTIREWEKRYKAGDLKPQYPKTRKPRKLPLDELKVYVEENPDDFLQEIGDKFGCSAEAVRKALKKLKLTRKKNNLGT
jgi:transposase